MNKRKLTNVFIKIKERAKLDYAITNTDAYGDCSSCVNGALADCYGEQSKGIFAKHWNKECSYAELVELYIEHDLTPEQGKILIDSFIADGYEITPKEYDERKCFLISENKIAE